MRIVIESAILENSTGRVCKICLDLVVRRQVASSAQPQQHFPPLKKKYLYLPQQSGLYQNAALWPNTVIRFLRILYNTKCDILMSNNKWLEIL